MNTDRTESVDEKSYKLLFEKMEVEIIPCKISKL